MAMEFFVAWCSQFKGFYVRLDAACARLRRAVEEPPASRSGNNFPKFIDNLNEAVVSMSNQLEALAAVTVSNVGQEEIFGHCMELYKQNEAGISALEAQLANYGYTPGPQIFSQSNSSSIEASDLSAATPDTNERAKAFFAANELSPATFSVSDDYADYDDDPLFDESFSLRDLGLSSAAWEVLAANGNDAKKDDTETSGIRTAPESQTVVQSQPDVTPIKAPTRQPTWKANGSLAQQYGKDELDSCTPRTVDSPPPPGDLVRDNEACGLAGVSEEEFDKVPPFLKRRFPLQELNDTIVKLSNLLNAKGNRNTERIDPTDLELLNLGEKSRECLLLLVRLGRLTFDNGNPTAYRPVFS